MGGRSSRQQVVEQQAEEPKELLVDEAANVEEAVIASVKQAPVTTVAEEDVLVEATYEEVLERCAELRGTRQELLKARMEVSATIARLSSASHDSDSDSDDLDSTADSTEAVEAPATYGDALVEQKELEDELEYLRETLDAAAGMIAGVMQKSNELSDHLDEVNRGIELKISAKPALDTAADASSDDAHVKVSQLPMKTKPEELKLPPLGAMTDAKQPGSSGSEGSGASSSTATPRSEKSSDSRVESARSESACWNDAKDQFQQGRAIRIRALGGN